MTIPALALPEPSERPRVLLDTNIWRYVVDAKEGGRLLKLARHGPGKVVIAPAVLYETLRLNDTSLRNMIVHLMTDASLRRLMPEAYSESIEIVHEIKRVRPDWLRQRPDLTFFERGRKDWSRQMGGFWVRCRQSPASEAGYITRSEGGLMEAAKEQAQFARREMFESGWAKKNPPMDKTLAAYSHPLPGWRGDMVEAWRWDSLTSLNLALGQVGNPYRDWIAPFVEIDDGLVGSAEWVQFWLYLVEARRLPRQWMRWAVSFAQRFRTVSPGAPGDTQLSTYFLEVDYFVTADNALIDILEECRPYAPCRLPTPIRVAGGKVGVEEFFAASERL